MRRFSGGPFPRVMAAAAAATLVACATAKTPAARVDRVALGNVVKDRLAKEPRLAAVTKVDVSSRTGAVILSGRVASKEEREVAGRLACSVKGVSVVYNEIQVRRADR